MFIIIIVFGFCGTVFSITQKILVEVGGYEVANGRI